MDADSPSQFHHGSTNVRRNPKRKARLELDRADEATSSSVEQRKRSRRGLDLPKCPDTQAERLARNLDERQENDCSPVSGHGLNKHGLCTHCHSMISRVLLVEWTPGWPETWGTALLRTMVRVIPYKRLPKLVQSVVSSSSISESWKPGRRSRPLEHTL